MFIGNNGKEAIEFYKRTSDYPDIILMDYRMPLMDGIKTSREILQINSNHKIIFLSADDSVKPQVEKLGIKFFLDKPVDMDLLVQNIEIAVEPLKNG